MKALNVVLRIILALLLVSPILGTLGIFPPPTADMYSSPEAFAFIDMLMTSKFVTYIMAIVFAFAIFLIITNRMALAALLIAPITVNIVAFHVFLDGGLFTASSIMADLLLLLNAYFLWQNRGQYKTLWDKFPTSMMHIDA